jgi:parvulin-like peptidyl-prolyl isomerase
MLNTRLHRLTRTALLLPALIALPACSDEPQSHTANTMIATAPGIPAADNGQAPDVVARVGDELITFSQLNTTLNSSAMVGLSVPALGTPERYKVIVTLLDKAISANLLYLDAKKQGVDTREPYATDMARFEDAVLASLYKSKVLIGDIPVSDEEVQTYFKTHISPDTEFTDDVGFAIEAKLREQKLNDRKASLRDRLRAGATVTVNEALLSPGHDSERSADEIVATIDGAPIRWSDIETQMRGADYRASLAEFYIDDATERMTRLQEYIDNRLMTDKARAAGMQQDPKFARDTAEYRKTHLINVHRSALLKRWKPSDDELRSYFMEHQDRISVPEARKVQMVVVKSEDEAKKIKVDIERGDITLYQAAQKFSLDPNAKHTLGEMGWVNHGTGFPELDNFTFALAPDVVGGPVQSPAGWHLVKVQEVRDAQFQSFDDTGARERTFRLYMQEKLNNYVVDLRKNSFQVAVYDDVLTGQIQNQANYIAELNKKAVQKGSVTEQRAKDLQKWIGAPPQQ